MDDDKDEQQSYITDGFLSMDVEVLKMYQLTSTSLDLCELESAFRYSKHYNAFLWYERKSQRLQKESLCWQGISKSSSYSETLDW